MVADCATRGMASSRRRATASDRSPHVCLVAWLGHHGTRCTPENDRRSLEPLARAPTHRSHQMNARHISRITAVALAVAATCGTAYELAEPVLLQTGGNPRVVARTDLNSDGLP